jgi:hypothetical protein
MMADEKMRLLALLEQPGKWCQDAEARDANGDPVCCDDVDAVAWDITGALCRLFSWERACVLFRQFDRHLHGKRTVFGWPRRDVEMDAMAALQAFNDRGDTTFALLRERIESMPVWQGSSRESDALQEC